MATLTLKKTTLNGKSSSEINKSRYLPIENYGVIGDLHTIALVGINGSIDWYCAPHFDSPSVFGAILDANKGGHFKIAPTVQANHRQMYFPDTNVLMTRFLNDDGVGEVLDFMPVEADAAEHHNHAHAHQIVRLLKVVRGKMRFRLDCRPAFNYGRDNHKTKIEKRGVIFNSKNLAVALQSPIKLKRYESGVFAEFNLKAGQSLTFIFKQIEKGNNRELFEDSESGESHFNHTVDYWRFWLAKSQYKGRWREMVNRSALTLKLLTFAPTGAIVAAPTASLPEEIGGVRNWDYRFTWIRDASFTLFALLRLGFTGEAKHFMSWIQHRIEELGPDGRLQIMYGIRGEHKLTEVHLNHWEGYKGSSPVNIGNAAYDQLQLDIYGELMDSVYLYDKYGSPISHDFWMNLTKLLDYVCKNWHRKDEGIWEVRGGRQHFVYSKLMCWVALDRGLRLARKRSFPGNWALWYKTRDKIYNEIMTKGWDPKQKAFVQYFGSSALDASNLIMPLVKFISPTDPRMISTLKQTKKKLVSDTLVHRYATGKGAEDGLAGKEGTFSMCTFWYAEALARSGKTHEARYIFEQMLGYANHLGLFSEEIGASGESLGNFPQAFTHLGLISAAYNLDQSLGRRG